MSNDLFCKAVCLNHNKHLERSKSKRASKHGLVSRENDSLATQTQTESRTSLVVCCVTHSVDWTICTSEKGWITVWDGRARGCDKHIKPLAHIRYCGSLFDYHCQLHIIRILIRFDTERETADFGTPPTVTTDRTLYQNIRTSTEHFHLIRRMRNFFLLSSVGGITTFEVK